MNGDRRETETLPDTVSAQHGQLFGAIRSLRETWESGSGWEGLSAGLDLVARRFRDHFDYEELLLQRNAYPRLDEHRQQHVAFLRRLETLRDECERRETQLMGVLIELLEAWFRSHEQHADRPAIAYLGEVD